MTENKDNEKKVKNQDGEFDCGIAHFLSFFFQPVSFAIQSMQYVRMAGIFSTSSR